MGQSMNPGLAWILANRIRINIRVAFASILLFAILLPSLTIWSQKRRSDVEQAKHRDVTEQRMVDRFLSPAGQLALLNPSRINLPATPLHPVILPFREIQANIPSVVLDQVRAVGCPIQFKRTADAPIEQGSICVGLRRSDAPEVHGPLLVTGTFISSTLIPHVFIDVKAGRKVARRFQDAHRITVMLRDGKDSYGWIFPIQVRINPRTLALRDGLGLTAYRLNSQGRPITWKPDFKEAWITEGECIKTDDQASTCMREHMFSIAIPRDRWGPPDHAVSPGELTLDIAINAPNSSGKSTTIFDSTTPQTTVAPFGASDIEAYLLPGESLVVSRPLAGKLQDLFRLSRPQVTKSSRLQTLGEKALNLLSIHSTQSAAEDEVRRSFGLRGDAFLMTHGLSVQGLDPELLQSWRLITAYSILMIFMLLVVWITLEVRIVRRVIGLTRRTRLVSLAVRTDGNLKQFDFSALRGRDELGVLATGLDDLLKRIADDVQRNTIRTQHERSMLRAIGHEIRAPLQSLSAVLADSELGSAYVRRMLKAVSTLYGSDSPSIGIQGVTLEADRLDLADFLVRISKNAHYARIDNVEYDGPQGGVEIRADESALEDAISHILENAQRYRREGTPIQINLEIQATTAYIRIHNSGAHIPDHLIDRIFEYGVSETLGDTNRQGQGLYVASTYLSKMGGTVSPKNVVDGVVFLIELPVIKG